ncbi:MAG: glycosyltransferase [Desulfuromonas sp.]|nr:glycosyltransferase [Desulfuromonas sp.]
MKNILILTNNFPCEGGEQFLETEIRYWGDLTCCNVYIMPLVFNDTLRPIPDNIKIIRPLINKWNFFDKLSFFFKAIAHKNLWKELYLFVSYKKIFKAAAFLNIFKSVMLFEKEKFNLNHALKLIEGDVLVYSYWNTFGCYAAADYKKKGRVSKVVSRAHGYDLYEENSKFDFLPLKRQFLTGVDELYLLSQSAINYCAEKFSVDKARLNLGRLGVEVPIIMPSYTFSSSTIRVLSISYCVPVKRIDKILAALCEYSRVHAHVEVDWTHVGAGPLYEKFSYEVINIKQKNFKARFVGQLSNTDVLKLLDGSEFDVFINSSESEGVPVSIMEAMSFGIPTIAPDVGGVSDIVNSETGYLMPPLCSPEDICYGIRKIIGADNITRTRVNARELIKKKFNAKINYKLFIQKVVDS